MTRDQISKVIRMIRSGHALRPGPKFWLEFSSDPEPVLQACGRFLDARAVRRIRRQFDKNHEH